MNISTIFFTCLAVAVIGFLAAIINMITFGRIFKSGESWGWMAIHLISIVFYVLGILGTIISGIAWIVTYLKH